MKELKFSIKYDGIICDNECEFRTNSLKSYGNFKIKCRLFDQVLNTVSYCNSRTYRTEKCKLLIPVNIEKRYIFEYVRNNHGQAIGVIAAVMTSEGIHVGWSKCCKGDKFNKETGLKMAKDFNISLNDENRKFPKSFSSQFTHLVSKSIKYFKTTKLTPETEKLNSYLQTTEIIGNYLSFIKFYIY